MPEGPAPSTAPVQALAVDHLFTLTAQVSRAATIDGGPSGTRVVVHCTGGTFAGPRVSGTVAAPSGDWVLVGSDGCMRLDVRMLLRTGDGADILMTYRGVSADGGATIRAAPMFETAEEHYSWLNTVQAVATGSSGGGQVTYVVYSLL